MHQNSELFTRCSRWMPYNTLSSIPINSMNFFEYRTCVPDLKLDEIGNNHRLDPILTIRNKLMQISSNILKFAAAIWLSCENKKRDPSLQSKPQSGIKFDISERAELFLLDQDLIEEENHRINLFGGTCKFDKITADLTKATKKINWKKD